MANNILIVDDEKNIRRSLRGILEDEGFFVEEAATGEEALEKANNNFFQVIFLDVMLPGMNGIEALKKIKNISPESYVIMMSGHANLEMAVEATRIGAYNFFEKPLVPEKILLEIEHISSRRSIEAEVHELRKFAGWGEIIGASAPMLELKKLIARIAPTDGRVFITGENGTGKELVARAIHLNSSRKENPFVKINCAAIPKDLIESELFGYEKGAFTGATNRKIGRIEEAHTGTLFLDEVGDMSLDTQAKLLRVLEESELVLLGGSSTVKFDIRVISATNQDIAGLIDAGKFREDLHYRLRVLPVIVPPLRERAEDIPILVNHFLHRFAERNNKPKISIDEHAVELLTLQEWRGNIRELKNVIERIVIMADSLQVTGADITPYLPAAPSAKKTELVIPEINGRSLRQIIDEYEEVILRREYSQNNGNVSKLAAALKVDRANLHRKLKQLGIK